MIGIGIGPAGALDRIPGPWHGEPATTAASPAEPTADCHAPAAPAPTTPVVTPAGSASVSQQISVVVPPIVRVQSDEGGVLSVRTNAARPPAPGDLVYLTDANGDYVPADDDLVARVMSARWADGSWCSTTAEHRSVG